MNQARFFVNGICRLGASGAYRANDAGNAQIADDIVRNRGRLLGVAAPIVSLKHAKRVSLQRRPVVRDGHRRGRSGVAANSPLLTSERRGYRGD